MSACSTAEYTVDLGRCCGCGRHDEVQTIGFLNRKCPLPGKGWGCLQCGLPRDGAQFVLCDGCASRAEAEGLMSVLKMACRGNPATDGRLPYRELIGSHEHDMSKRRG